MSNEKYNAAFHGAEQRPQDYNGFIPAVQIGQPQVGSARYYAGFNTDEYIIALEKERDALREEIVKITPSPVDKKLNVAYILLFFFGVLGVHRFYAGRIGTGLLWLFTFGCLGIGVLVDVFILKDVVDRANEELRNARWRQQMNRQYIAAGQPPLGR